MKKTEINRNNTDKEINNMSNTIYFHKGEEVEYLSRIDHTWKRGIISRFSEDGFSTVAIIEEESFVNKLPLNSDYIRKILKNNSQGGC